MLTIRRGFPRPRSLAPFQEAAAGWLADANGRRGALDFRIRPLTRATRFCGTAPQCSSSSIFESATTFLAFVRYRPIRLMYCSSPGTPSFTMACGVLAALNSSAVARFTDLSVACAESTTATRSSYGVL